MTRTQRLALADTAATRAAALARDAELFARSSDTRTKAQPIAAAGALWANVARAHAAIAAAMTDTDTTTEA